MPRKNKRTELTQDDVRKKVWRHNSFFGHARMMLAQCESIIHSPTTSPDTKATAQRISSEVHVLIKNLKVRIDK